ncbi:MAG: hypothetical protein KDD25_09170, partial [Bdellovibrionales bacterium]|nr:hypothetical protein [Bdellovibrionales bacterium]
KKGLPTQPSLMNEFLVFGTSKGPVFGVNKKNGTQEFEYVPGRGALAPITTDSKTGNVYLVSTEGNIHNFKAKWVPRRPLLDWEEL